MITLYKLDTTLCVMTFLFLATNCKSAVSSLNLFRKFMCGYSKNSKKDVQERRGRKLQAVHNGQHFTCKSYVPHNSLEGVQILNKLFVSKMTCYSKDLFPFHIHSLQKSFKSLVEQKAMSSLTFRKIAEAGLGMKHICLAHMRDKLCGVKTL